MTTETVTLGVQAGDVASSDATQAHSFLLRRLLSAYCVGPYSDEIEEFALVLRISGDICAFEGEGCQRLRISRKRGYVTIDIVMPRSRWERRGASDIKEFLAHFTQEAIDLMASKLIKSKIKVDSIRLNADVREALSRFLAAPSE